MIDSVKNNMCCNARFIKHEQIVHDLYLKHEQPK